MRLKYLGFSDLASSQMQLHTRSKLRGSDGLTRRVYA